MRLLKLQAIALAGCLLLSSVGCRGGRSTDPTGTWSLYVPPDMIAMARHSGELPPTGSLRVMPGGGFEMRVQQAPGRLLQAEGRWTMAHGSVTLVGTEQTIAADGKPAVRSFRSTGTLSEDGRRLRVYGRDFVR